MDKSGDGKISNSEVISGFRKLEFNEKEDAALEKITENVCALDDKKLRCKPSSSPNHIPSCNCTLICFKDFLLCSISLDQVSFLNYMNIAYGLFFNNNS